MRLHVKVEAVVEAENLIDALAQIADVEADRPGVLSLAVDSWPTDADSLHAVREARNG